MAELILMPKLSDTMEEGVIAKWLKKEGDAVSEGDILAEIETDKATMDYESPQTGVILKLIAEPGKKLALGQPICVVGQKGEKFESSMLAKKDSAPATKDVDEEKKVNEDEKDASTSEKKSSSTVASIDRSTARGSDDARRIKASPLAKKIAHDRGIDLQKIQGSGPSGRIVLRDIDEVKAGTAGITRVTGSSADRLVPVSMMRQTIAKRLHTAKNEAPHFYLTRSINMETAIAWRTRLNEAAEKSKDVPKISVNDIVMMACSRALKIHRACNASWQGENILEFGAVHMAMAVALPTGLITPVIRNCDQLGVREIATQSRLLAQKAKAGELKPDEYLGGTFTVSNLGMFGIEEFTAIINPPQAGILAVGATAIVPWVDSSRAVVAQNRMKITMSCDHRVIDGALGAMFMQTLVEYLEDPLAMLA